MPSTNSAAATQRHAPERRAAAYSSVAQTSVLSSTAAA